MIWQVARSVTIKFRTSRHQTIRSISSPSQKRLAAEYFGVGVIAGAAGSLVGLGGGFIALPFLSGYFNLTQNIAHGTSMAVVLATSLGSTVSYGVSDKKDTLLRNGTNNNKGLFGILPEVSRSVHILNAVCLAATSSVAVVAGAWISKRSPARYLKFAHGCLMMIVGPMIPAQDYFKQLKPARTEPSLIARNRTDDTPSSSSSSIKTAPTNSSTRDGYSRYVRPLTIGVLSGFMAGVFGVGGGAVMVPCLVFFTDMDYHMALGTSLAAMLPTAVVGSITQYRQGMMNVRAAMPLSIGCLTGSYLGAQYGKNIPSQDLKFGFAALMMAMGVKTMSQAVKLMRLAR